jgi:hypothetical protein
MTLNKANARKYLKSFDFKKLFIEELGWDRHDTPIEVDLPEKSIPLKGIAQKRGVVAYLCALDELPDYSTRRKIEQQVVKVTREHFIIFTDCSSKTQIWQWVRREPGKPTACREHHYRVEQSGDALIQKLQTIAFSLEEEDKLTLPDVTSRTRQSFDVERVTKRFYDRFKTEHAAFLEFISGIKEQADHEWYTSVMLNRLMFIYFIQRKGFLDGDSNYLRNRLSKVKKEHGQDKFYSFYRYFLLKLFHEGLGKKSRSKELDTMLGKIPYLNGGLFDIHVVEQNYSNIQIPDEAFERIFDYFDQYQWHLDERPLRADNEINPDVLGYIFEKYINQKQMGAYYTKEDITEYISKNTVLPFLFNAAKPHCTIAFENPGGSTIWDILAGNPERYIYPAVKHGVIRADGSVLPETELPDFVQKGMKDPKARMFENRYNLQQAQSEDPIRLVTETWREYVYRRERCLDILGKLKNGEIKDINDLITYNLDIRQFAQDVIDNSEGPELIRAFWTAIEKVTVLDPTCGSGAFLFAALNILEPLYEACLNRMESFIEDDAQYEPGSHVRFTDFKAILKRVETHPNRRYFIFKSIILNNLYGVDIMEEAVEICRLRLFLKLAAQVEPEPSKDNFGIEPLPDIDFNIRSGNTLVGYISMKEVRSAMASKLDVDDAMARFQAAAQGVDTTYRKFRTLQTENCVEASDVAKAKREVLKQLSALSKELDYNLAVQYRINQKNFDMWKKIHQPFHWVVEYYGIMNQGGFDVIIGNPPYLELREVDYSLQKYKSLDSGTIHGTCIERGLQLLRKEGSMSMIVPLSIPSTQRMLVVQQLLEEINRNVWYANYAWRPAKLFDTVNRALTIFITCPSSMNKSYSTKYQRWTSDSREGLFSRVSYIEIPRRRSVFWVPKLGNEIERSIMVKLFNQNETINSFILPSNNKIYYRTTGGLYWKVFTDFAPAFTLNGKSGSSSRETWFSVSRREQVRPFIAVLSSDLFWWWYTISSNLRDLNPNDIHTYPVTENILIDKNISKLAEKYIEDLRHNSIMLVREQKQTGTTATQSFKIQKSKHIIDEIDQALAKHYNLTDEEVDFIVNYDVKYRLGDIDED